MVIMSILKFLFSQILHWFQQWQKRLSLFKSNPVSVSKKGKTFNLNKHVSENEKVTPLYEQDYLLTPIGQQFLFYEYLEMSNIFLII